MDIRIYYLPPPYSDEIESKRYSREWRNEIIHHAFVRVFDIHTFALEFNEDHISDLGYIVIPNKDKE